MNIVHIIGNGFDLNLGLKTSYKSFYEYYNGIKSKNGSVTLLKKEIELNSENWSDLEIALGEFTAKIKTVEEFENVRQDIILNLSNYLKTIEESFDLTTVNQHELSIFLSSPHISLRNGDKAILKNYIDSVKHETARIDIISFNYTSILDNLIKEYVNKQMSFANSISKNSVVRPIKHLHGSLQERLIIGVNDNSQVSNDNFINDIDFTESFIKTEYNKAANHLVDDECVELINRASIICIFGSSLGLTDRFWWELICDRILKENCKLIIYHKTFKIENQLFGNLVSKEIRHLKDMFVSFKKTITKEEADIIKSNIYVGVNTNFYKILKSS